MSEKKALPWSCINFLRNNTFQISFSAFCSFHADDTLSKAFSICEAPLTFLHSRLLQLKYSVLQDESSEITSDYAGHKSDKMSQ